MNDRTIQRVILFFAVISIVLVIVTVLAVRNINRSVASADWVNHTHEIILEGQGLLSALRAGDSALRTYLLSGDQRDQIAARDAFALVEEHLDVVGALTRSESEANALFAPVAPLVRTRTQLATALAAPTTNREQAVAALLAIDQGEASIGEIERRLTQLREQQMDALARRDTASYLQAQATRWTLWSGVALNLLLLAGVGWLIRDDIAARRRAAQVLQTANQQLEEKVRERTAELVATNDNLANENLERRWANEALEHQLRYDRLIVDSIGDLVLVLTKILNISRVNPAVVQLTGFDPPALINRPLSDLVQLRPEAGEADTPLIDPIAHALRSGHDLHNRPARLKNVRGVYTPVNLTLRPLRDGNKVVGGVVILQRLEAPSGRAPENAPPS